MFGFHLWSFICFDILIPEFCIFMIWLLVLGFLVKLHVINSVRIEVIIFGEKNIFLFCCYLNKGLCLN